MPHLFFRRRRARLISVLVALLLAAGCWGGGDQAPADPIPPITTELRQREEVIRKRFDSAEQRWNAGELDAALVELREIVRLDLHHPLAAQGAVQVALRRGGLERAPEQARELLPDSEPARRYARGVAALFGGDLAAAEKLLESSAEEYAELRHPAGLAASRTAVGIACAWTSRFDEAIEHFTLAREISERLGDRRAVADLHTNLGGVRRDVGDEREALAEYRRALSIQEELSDQDGRSATLYNMSLVLIDRGDLDGAADFLGRALEINIDLGDRAREGRTRNALARIDLEREMLEEAGVGFAAALAAAREFADAAAEADVISNLGRIDLRRGMLDSALALQQAALEIRRDLGDRAGEASSLHHIGVVQERQGVTAKALQSFEAALAIYRTVRTPRGEAMALDSLGRLRARTGDRGEGIAALERSVELYARIGSMRGEASTRTALAEALMAAADYGRARLHLDRALEIWKERESAGATGRVETLRTLGVLDGKRGAYDSAAAFLEEARQRLVEASDVAAEAEVLTDIGSLRFAQGDFIDALRLQHAALDIRRQLGDRAGEANNLNHIGAIHRALGDPDRATQYLRDAMRRMEALDDLAGVSRVRSNLGVLFEEVGDPDAARAEYRESIRIREALQDLRGSAFSRHRLASVLARRDQAEEAEQVLDEALNTFRVIGDRGAEALTLVELGDLARDQGKLATAVGHYQEALGFAASSGMREAAWRAEAGTAACMEAGGEWSQALKYYERAIDGIESVRRRRITDEFQPGAPDGRLRQYERIVWLLRNHGHNFLEMDPAARGFEYAERARSRSLLDLLAAAGSDLHAGVNPDLAERESELFARMAQLETDLRGPREEEERRGILSALAGAEQELDLLGAAIRDAAPAYAEIRYPRPVTVREVRASLLGPDEVLFEYLLGEEASYLWVVRRDELRWWELPPRAEIETAVRRLLAALRTEAEHRTAGRALAAMLMPEGARPDGGGIIVVPDGILNYLPFEALPIGAGLGESYLVERLRVSYAPSASSLRPLRRGDPAPADATLFALGDPPTADLPDDWEIPPLPFAGEEIGRIGRLFPAAGRVVRVGDQASETALKRTDLTRFRFLHLATNGWIHEQAPVRSGIFLGRDAGTADDGMLRLNEIFRMRMAVDLVVLSASQVGIGEPVRGDGMVGFTRALFYAGARSVIVSLWNGNNRSTTALMEAMYGRLVRGEPPSAALRQAKLAMIRSDNPAFRHPSRWAAFLLSGAPGRSRQPVPGK